MAPRQLLFNCVYLHIDVAAHLPPVLEYVATSSNEEANGSSNTCKQKLIINIIVSMHACIATHSELVKA